MGTEFSHITGDQLSSLLHPQKTALLVIDVQEDFASQAGVIGRAGADLSQADATIDRLERIIGAARSAGVPCIFLRVVTRPETDPPNLVELMSRKGMAGGQAICRADSSGADYYRVHPEPGDYEVEKLLYNSFHGTTLDSYLRNHNIDTLLLTGFSTDCCVDATARDAFHRGYHVFVATDACGGADQALHTSTLQCLGKHCALLLETGAVIEAWSCRS